MVSVVAKKQILDTTCSNVPINCIFLIGVRVQIKQLLLPSLSRRRRLRHFESITRRFEFIELGISLLIIEVFILATSIYET